MRILVDADSCCVVQKIEKLAKERNVPVILFCDFNHALHSDYSQIITVQSGKNAADYAIFNMCTSNDLVVTQDAGLASIVLGKKAKAIHPCGKIYSDDSIDRILNVRHLNGIERKMGRVHRKKKTSHNNQTYNFESALRSLLYSPSEVSEAALAM